MLYRFFIAFSIRIAFPYILQCIAISTTQHFINVFWITRNRLSFKTRKKDFISLNGEYIKQSQ